MLHYFRFSAFAFQAIFMIAAGYVSSSAGAVVCLTVAVGIGGFAWAGFSVNHLDIAPQVRKRKACCILYTLSWEPLFKKKKSPF